MLSGRHDVVRNPNEWLDMGPVREEVAKGVGPGQIAVSYNAV